MSGEQGPIGIIGLGAMGAALAQSLLNNGMEVHVWNRTAEKSVALVQKGAVQASQPADVCAASSMIIVCLSDYSAWADILEASAMREAIKGTTIAQLTTGTVAEVEDHAALMKRLGAGLIEGSILCFPEQIGTASASIIVAGEQGLVEEHDKVLRAMSPKISYLGDSPTAPVVLGNAIMSSVLGFSAGIINGAAFCLQEGLPLEAFKDQTIHNFTRMQTEPIRIIDAILEGDTESTQASVSTWYEAHVKLLELSDKLAVDKSFHQGLNAMFKQTINQGRGAHDISAMIKTFAPGK